MSDDFLAQLQAAQSDEEREWLALEFNLESLDPSVHEAVWAAAIPHWFDTPFLAALLDKPETDVAPIFDKLCSLSFIEVFPQRGHNVHERTRDLLLKRLWEHERDRYHGLHRRAATYCESQNQSDTRWHAERLYHQVMTDDHSAASIFVDQALEWYNRFEYGKLEALVQPVLSEMRIRPLPGETAAWVYNFQASLDLIYARYPRAKDYLELALNQNFDDPVLKADCLHTLGDVHYRLNEYQAAKQRLEEALSISKQSGNQISEANSLERLGRVYHISGDYDEARRSYEEALRIYRQINNPHGEANSLQGLATIDYMLDEVEKAWQRFEEALALYRKIGSQQDEANCINRLGDLLILKGEYNAARQRIEEALAIYRKLGSMIGEADSIMSLGYIHYRLNDYEPARSSYNEALEMFRHIHNRLGEAHCIRRLAVIHFSSEEYDMAQEKYNEALIIYRKIGHPRGEAICLEMLEEIGRKMAEG